MKERDERDKRMGNLRQAPRKTPPLRRVLMTKNRNRPGGTFTCGFIPHCASYQHGGGSDLTTSDRQATCWLMTPAPATRFLTA